MLERLYNFFFLSLLLQFLPFFLFASSSDSLRQIIRLESNDSVKAYLYIQLSNQYLDNMELDSCIVTARRGVVLSSKIGNETASLMNYEFIGQCYYYLGLHSQALKVFLETLTKGRELGQYNSMAKAYRMLGWIFIERGEFEKANVFLIKAIDICKRYKIQGEELALIYYGMGSVYSFRDSKIKNYKLGELYYDSSLAVQPGLRIHEKASVLSELGSLYREGKNNLRKSMDLLKEAEILIGNDITHYDVHANIFAEMAYNYSLMSEYIRSSNYANKAVDIYEGLPFRRKTSSVYELLAQTFINIGDSNSAFRVEHTNRILSDSIFGLYHLSALKEMQMNIEGKISAERDVATKEAEVRKLNQANLINQVNLANSHRTILIIAAISTIILFLVSIIFYNRNRYVRKIRKAEIKNVINDEKQRIAKDLHDNIGTQLTSLSLHIAKFEDRGNLTLDHVSYLRSNIDSIIVELRDTIWAIHRDEVTIAEFKNRVDNLVWRLQEQVLGIKFIVIVNDEFNDFTLKPIQAVNMFRIIQEAITNSLKHSGANVISLSVSLEKESHFCLIISDDGRGFVINDIDKENHFGLNNMKKRAEEMMGSLSLKSSPDTGTRIIVTCPL